jgi:hypothetical protein
LCPTSGWRQPGGLCDYLFRRLADFVVKKGFCNELIKIPKSIWMKSGSQKSVIT